MNHSAPKAGTCATGEASYVRRTLRAENPCAPRARFRTRRGTSKNRKFRAPPILDERGRFFDEAQRAESNHLRQKGALLHT